MILQGQMVLQIGSSKVIFRGKMFSFQNDCSSHQIKINFYIKRRWILINWKRRFFTTYLSTTTSFIFHTGATVQQQQNQLYRPVFMFSKGLFSQQLQRIVLDKWNLIWQNWEVFIPNGTIIKNILDFLHSNHRLGEF